jgi:hypothetical protein
VSRIILPNEAPRGARPLFVPHGYETPAILGYCRVPGCEREGAPFVAGQEELWQKHVGWCARKNRGNIEQVVGERKEARRIFDPNEWDPEWKAHQVKVGKRMLEEGRLVPKPHER